MSSKRRSAFVSRGTDRGTPRGLREHRGIVVLADTIRLTVRVCDRGVAEHFPERGTHGAPDACADQEADSNVGTCIEYADRRLLHLAAADRHKRHARVPCQRLRDARREADPG